MNHIPTDLPATGSPSAETETGEKRGRGKPKDPNALQFRTLGLRPRDWEYLSLWQTAEEKLEGNPEKGGNFTPALERLIEHVKVFAPGGEPVATPRDKKGRFLPSGGTSKGAIYRAKKRERAKREGGKEG